MQFIKFRLSGFKSFVDSTEVTIEPGLTGVVGPNGCGKSNLVEALRWVMGETSAKQMRGGAMDDVIFNGTQSRSARNLAEVAMTIDNSDRTAPAAFNDTDELLVSRRIERESGSTYRLNGREVRARDVQLLFADAATGAHSPALVSQGRIGAIISAKPTDRRALLEEAAGIIGLHSRRHEAELRLRGAANNLERLDDVMIALEGQLQAMKRQARQANRYRRIGGQIRRFEAIQLHLRHREAATAAGRLGDELATAEREVGDLTARVAAANSVHEAAAETLPALRQAEAAAAAGLHRLAVAEDGLDAEERRVAEEAIGLEARLTQIADDRRRESAIQEDAEAALRQLQAEEASLRAAAEGETAALVAAEARIESAALAVDGQEAELEKLTDETAAAAARREALQAQLREAAARLERLETRAGQTAAEAAEIDAALDQDDQVAARLETATVAEAEAAAAAEGAEAAEGTRAEVEAGLAEAREALQAAERAVAELSAEEAALAALLEVNESGLWAPLVDAVKVEPGYELALGAALGDDLNVPADEGAPVHWRTLEADGDATALPAGAVPLSRHVGAPPALARRLAQIGVVADADGALLSLQLAQGQRLVSVEGALWRWDGFTVTAGAETEAAARLAQRNRLAELRREKTDVEVLRDQARQGFEVARQAAETAGEALATARQQARQAEQAREAARAALAEAERHAAERISRRATLAELIASLASDVAETGDVRTAAETALAALPPFDAARDRLASLRQALAGLRSDLAEARNAEALLKRELLQRADRLTAIRSGHQAWQTRAADAERQLQTLSQRQGDTERDLALARAKPAEIAKRRRALLDEIATAEAARDKAAEALTRQEAEVEAHLKALREAERRLAEARETRARLEAALEAAKERVTEVARRVREVLDCAPEAALASAGIEADEELPALSEAETKLERLLRERERMGPVNLRAEQEAEELGEQLETMATERADLEAAINRLRHGIASLNREGRERLLAAFKQVDEHFQSLFVRLFGGGKAHLALTESDDPLEAGLEIMASPPGKRLQTMSLLSGGEQALTALSLLFAVFLTNPAPICVLDEVDAPLDDANVERFCNLAQEISRVTGTRFLIITHHAYTMARVDRLYGVTMAERGVSQLVSVDLGRAERLRAQA
ncbi:MAG: chromosome segregation protein SMC [Alphaproteobacteria bacterium]|nr:chromosome segregation protein SMC [Alphaproteobacteria bacterium]